MKTNKAIFHIVRGRINVISGITRSTCSFIILNKKPQMSKGKIICHKSRAIYVVCVEDSISVRRIDQLSKYKLKEPKDDTIYD